ncbi:MAG TPA: type II secretion system F family protein [Mycobacteriales bacterium]|nr:type II secretion system F family protein [Mycobacteriales bacterium]
MTGAQACAVGAVALAAWLRTTPAPRLQRPSHGRGGGVGAVAPEIVRARAGALAAAVASYAVVRTPVALVIGAVVGAATQEVWRRHRAARRIEAVRRSLPDVLRLVAGELLAGAPPHAALAAGAELAPAPLAAHRAAVASGARLGLDVADSLIPGPPGAEALRAVAACWRVSSASGAGLADGLLRLAVGLAADERCRDEVAAQLAGPRASALVLAALPGVAVLMAAGLGASPVQFFRTPAGGVCLAAGATLDALGLWWTRALARRAAR